MSPVHADEPDCGRTSIENSIFEVMSGRSKIADPMSYFHKSERKPIVLRESACTRVLLPGIYRRHYQKCE